jgi:hypothetical protein
VGAILQAAIFQYANSALFFRINSGHFVGCLPVITGKLSNVSSALGIIIAACYFQWSYTQFILAISAPAPLMTSGNVSQRRSMINDVPSCLLIWLADYS